MTKSLNPPESMVNEKFAALAAVEGQETARKLAQTGRIISAIKLLELMNPKLSRQHAKKVVNSFGYSSEPRWPHDDGQPLRCL